MSTGKRRTARRVETEDYGKFARRIIAGYRRRVGVTGDIGALRGLVELRDELDTAILAAGRQLHAGGYSFNELAAELGVTKSAAAQRFGVGRTWCLDCYSTLIDGNCPECVVCPSCGLNVRPNKGCPDGCGQPSGQLDKNATGWEWAAPTA